MIYVPNVEDYACYSLVDHNTIRAYEQTPVKDSVINYRDYYINSSYLFRDGVQSFGQYSTLPICLSKSELTSNVFYRNDIDKILVVTFIILIVCFYFPFRLISRLFGRWLKL